MAALTKDQLLDAIAEMTVLELSELIKGLEDKFGVTAAAPVAVAAPGAAAAATEAAEEQTEFDVVLKGVADGKKIPVIKEIRTVIAGLGLKEAKELVEEGNKVIREAVSKEEAASIKEKLEAAGAVIEIK